MTDDADILFERRGHLGLITLNRPKALNALTHEMCVTMKAQLDRWAKDGAVETVAVQGAGERAFCAGGDIRALYESGKNKTPYALDFYRDEYRLNAAIKHFPKPYIAFIDGIVMGGGVGVSVHGSHRIAGAHITFAMPETGIGLFPDVGGSYFLPRIGGAIGFYLALTGARLKLADCLYTGVATHFVPAEKHGAVIESFAEGCDPDAALGGHCGDAGEAPLVERAADIERIFMLDGVEAILAALEKDGAEWARDTAKIMRTKSPTSLKVTWRQLREGMKLGFDDCMQMEFRMVNRVVAGHDFYEGVRAAIIDKDGAPKWQPAGLEHVSEADVGAYFAPLGDKELKL